MWRLLLLQCSHTVTLAAIYGGGIRRRNLAGRIRADWMAWRHGRSVGGAGAGHVGAAVQSRQWTSGGVGGGGGWRREAAGASTAVGWTSLDFGLSLSLSLSALFA